MKSTNKKFILYTMSGCPFCVEAKKDLKDRDISFDTISFDNRPKVLKEIKQIYDWKTVPMVFERLDTETFKLIGGYTDLKNYLEGA